MRFCDKLYVGAGVRNLNKIVKDIYKHRAIHNIFCICLSQSRSGERIPALFEILSVSELYRTERFSGMRTIIGLGRGKKEATYVVVRIIKEIVNSGNIIDRPAIDRLIRNELN